MSQRSVLLAATMLAMTVGGDSMGLSPSGRATDPSPQQTQEQRERALARAQEKRDRKKAKRAQ